MILLWLRFPHYVRGKQLERQTELARQVQTDLLPAGGAAIENLDFAAACVPAWQVGGDFYDVFSAGDARIAIVLGDVSGKGLPAAVVQACSWGLYARASGQLEVENTKRLQDGSANSCGRERRWNDSPACSGATTNRSRNSCDT